MTGYTRHLLAPAIVRTLLVIIFIGGGSMLVACGSGVATQEGALEVPTPTATATATVLPTATATPTKVPTQVIPPTATQGPTATTRPLPTPTVVRQTPTRVAVPPSAKPGANTTVIDEAKVCKLTIPPGYTVDSGGDGFDANDASGIGVLTGGTGRSDSAQELAQILYESFSSVLDNVQQSKATPGPNTYQIDFTGDLASNPGKGTVYVKKFGTTACGVSIFTYDDAAIPHATVVNAILPTVQENK